MSENDNPGIRLGTSAFTAAGWPGTFYREGLPERDYLGYYATKFDTVEVDSTFYRAPAPATVEMFRGLRNAASGRDRIPPPNPVSGLLFE
jgi:uncharacterized protein YecE (DUF72 family)